MIGNGGMKTIFKGYHGATDEGIRYCHYHGALRSKSVDPCSKENDLEARLQSIETSGVG